MLACSSNNRNAFEHNLMATELKEDQKHKLRAFKDLWPFLGGHSFYMDIFFYSRHWFIDSHYVGMLQ